MTDPDARLAALFAEEAPPARDPVFQAEVLARLVRRRFLVDLARLSVASGAGAAVLWAIWPTLVPAIETVGQGLAPATFALMAAASIVVLASGRILSPRS